jgi:hypothetical protein
VAYEFALHLLGTFTNTGNFGYLSVGHLNLHLVAALNLEERVTMFTRDERVYVLLIDAPSREVRAGEAAGATSVSFTGKHVRQKSGRSQISYFMFLSRQQSVLLVSS